jgi:hypothetical protein
VSRQAEQNISLHPTPVNAVPFRRHPAGAGEFLVGRVEGKEYLRTCEANAIRRSDRARRSSPDGGQDMIDSGLIAMFLKMTPEERLQANDNAVRIVMELRDAFKRRKREAAGRRSERPA